MSQALIPHQFTLDSAITEWLAQKQTTGSERTVKAYRENMQAFRAFLARGNLDLLDAPVDIARIATLWANMRNPLGEARHPDQDVAPNTYNQRLASLSSFYTFLQEVYHLQITNPIKDIPKKRVQAYAAAVPVDIEKVEDGLAAINRRNRQGLRDYAILAVALATGRRASELVGLRGRDVKMSGRKEIRVTLTFHCKGNKVMRDTLDVETSAVFLEYLHAEYGKQLLTIQPDAPVWVSYSKANKGQPIGTKTLSNICVNVLDTSKVHALRHTFAVGMVKSNAPITELSGRLGHTDLKTTQIYTKEIMGDENPYGEKLSQRFGIRRRGK